MVANQHNQDMRGVMQEYSLEERSILANLERYTIEMDEKVVPDPCFVLLPRIGSRLHP